VPVAQSHHSNIILIKQFLISYIFFLVGGRELSGKPRAETRTGSWALNCVSCSQPSSAACQHSNSLGFLSKYEHAAFRPASHHFKCSLFAFADTSSVTAGADKHLSRLLSTFSAAPKGQALPTRCFAADLHSDTLLKGLPASHSFMWFAANHQLFWLLFFFFLTPAIQSEHKHSWSPLCCGSEHICACSAATAWKPRVPAPAQLHHSWWQCHAEPGTRDHSVGMRPSITRSCQRRRNRPCGREAGGGRVDLLQLSASHHSSIPAPLDKHQTPSTARRRTALLGTAL